jgi:hypothetical protein
MRPLTAHDVLAIWEVGQGQSPPERALTILAAAFPGATRDQLADLPVGRRDAGLLGVREWLFGPLLHGFVECTRCRERLEFALDVAALRGAGPDRPPEAEFEMTAEGVALRFRLPTTRDLLAVAGRADPAAARTELLRLCVRSARRGEADIDAVDLPEAVVAHLAERIAESGPAADLTLDFLCSACGHGWSDTLDIVSFLWKEVAALARRLLREVHALARAYGWREADILAMSARRRQSYLEMVGA